MTSQLNLRYCMNAHRMEPSMTSRILPFLFLVTLAAGCSSSNDTDLKLSGIMEATTVRVSAQVPGLVTQLSFDEGSMVTRDSVLLVVNTERLDHQISQSDATMDEISHQAQSLDAQIRAATVSRDNVAQRLSRLTALLAENAATQQSVDDLRAQKDAADAQIAALRAQAAALVSRRAQVQAGARVLGTQRRDASILAPIDGTVLVRYADVGELLGVGSPVCDIADLRVMYTKVYLEETYLPAFRIGMDVDVLVDGTEGKPLHGTLTWISDKAEFTPKTILTEETRTSLVFPAKVTVPNADGLLKIGMPVTVVARGVKQ